MRSDVSFGLNDLPAEVPSSQAPNKDLAEKLPRNIEGGSAVEVAFKFHSEPGYEVPDTESQKNRRR